MSFWSLRLDQNTNENFENFCSERAMAETIKIFVGVLVQMMISKRQIEINWPLSGAMSYKWIPSRSKIENWILSKFIQILTIIQIFVLAFGLLILINNDGPYITNRIPVLVPFSFISIGLVSCILMRKVTLNYWKWKEEKTGRFLFKLCSFISVVSSLIFLDQKP